MNPLLSRDFRIPFDEIRPEHIEPGVRAALAQAEDELRAVIDHPGERSYANTVQALDDVEEHLDRAVGIASHLAAVRDSPELRQAYNAVVPEFSAFYARLPLNEGVWRALKAYAETPEARALTGVRQRHLEKTLREFVRAGADLPAEKKAEVEALRVELSKLHTEFSNNVLDATNAFELAVTEEDGLAGLPESAKAQARASAEAKGQEGYRFTLQLASYQPFMQYAENRELREKLHTAFVNRASAPPLDNRPLIAEILRLRRELAGLLGYTDFADYRLEPNMVKDDQAALEFERDLTARTVPFWHKEVGELESFATDELGLSELRVYDVAYVAEKLRKAKFALDEEELRPYFALDNVLEGLFAVTRRLFGVTVTKRDNTAVWHPEVEFYDIHDEDGTHLGSFYADWFPRESKRGGAWMNHFITGGPREGGFAPHLGLICANFTPPQAGAPALLTHREVETVFHEFGHLLHHCLSRVEVAARAGTSVPRDWVELPSQLMENWTWEREALDLFARHYQTGEKLPGGLYQKMRAARTFMAAQAQMRQLSFGTVDLEMHVDYRPESSGDEEPVAYAQRVMEPFNIKPEFAHNHFITSFNHVFCGAYAAGYYSYKWSEMLEADVFSRFQAEGIFNRKTGQAYLNSILSRGDSADPNELFHEFMGRDPDPEALLRRNLGAAEVQS